MARSFATLNGVPFVADPEDISWDFTMKVQEMKTIGGKVIQILGAHLGDLTVVGRFGYGPASKGGENWGDQMKFRDQIIRIARRAEKNPNPKPVRFSFTPRNWNFDVWVKSFNETTFTNTDIAPQYRLVLAVDEAGAGDIAKGLKDLYLKRLVDGVGWKQTEYNGPSADEITTTLGGKTVGEYLASLSQEAFDAGLPGGRIGTGATDPGALP